MQLFLPHNFTSDIDYDTHQSSDSLYEHLQTQLPKATVLSVMNHPHSPPVIPLNFDYIDRDRLSRLSLTPSDSTLQQMLDFLQLFNQHSFLHSSASSLHSTEFDHVRDRFLAETLLLNYLSHSPTFIAPVTPKDVISQMHSFYTSTHSPHSQEDNAFYISLLTYLEHHPENRIARIVTNGYRQFVALQTNESAFYQRPYWIQVVANIALSPPSQSLPQVDPSYDLRDEYEYACTRMALSHIRLLLSSFLNDNYNVDVLVDKTYANIFKYPPPSETKQTNSPPPLEFVKSLLLQVRTILRLVAPSLNQYHRLRSFTDSLHAPINTHPDDTHSNVLSLLQDRLPNSKAVLDCYNRLLAEAKTSLDRITSLLPDILLHALFILLFFNKKMTIMYFDEEQNQQSFSDLFTRYLSSYNQFTPSPFRLLNIQHCNTFIHNIPFEFVHSLSFTLPQIPDYEDKFPDNLSLSQSLLRTLPQPAGCLLPPPLTYSSSSTPEDPSSIDTVLYLHTITQSKHTPSSLLRQATVVHWHILSQLSHDAPNGAADSLHHISQLLSSYSFSQLPPSHTHPYPPNNTCFSLQRRS